MEQSEILPRVAVRRFHVCDYGVEPGRGCSSLIVQASFDVYLIVGAERHAGVRFLYFVGNRDAGAVLFMLISAVLNDQVPAPPSGEPRPMIRTVQVLAVFALISIVGCGASDATYQKTLSEIDTLEKSISDKRIESFAASKNGDEAGSDKCLSDVASMLDKTQSLIDIAKRISPRNPDNAKWAEAAKKYDDLSRKIDSLYEEQTKSLRRKDFDRAIEIEKEVWALTVDQDKACRITWVTAPKD
jgi:hypothetical protein